MEILTLKNVNLIYHSDNSETETLKNINFGIDEGEFISIVGPSGCGKSTLLSLISGILKASSGEILLDGKRILGVNNDVKYMFQKDHLFPWRTIEENIFLGLEIEYSINKRKKIQSSKQIFENKKKYAINLLEKYGLGEFKKHYPNQLSGGMKQRVSLIRTLSLNPKLLLLDEPFSAIDFQNRLKLCDDVSKIIASENKTAILVTHDISEAVSMSDRVIVLSKRPAQIKKIFDIDLKKYGEPLKRRDSVQFNKYFDKIWEELNND